MHENSTDTTEDNIADRTIAIDSESSPAVKTSIDDNENNKCDSEELHSPINMSTTTSNDKIDVGSILPPTGDPRRPPAWSSRLLVYIALSIGIMYFLWKSWPSVSFLVLDIVISLFIALAIEPAVLIMVRRGWKRSAATMMCLVSLGAIIAVLLVLFGNMFVQQVMSMLKSVPKMYSDAVSWTQSTFDLKIPGLADIGASVFTNEKTSTFLTGLAGQALSTTMGLFNVLISLLTVVMVTYYISASGPKMKRSLCQWMNENMQRQFILIWTIIQEQISGFLFSRTILAALNAFCTGIFLMTIKVPYWMPLALFCGLVSQFIPTIGTYIGGALPVLFALGSGGLKGALIVLIFIVVYQQIENFLFSPIVSQQTMSLNPAIAFLSVLLFGALFGALGAFLALPLAASIQALFHIYIKRYELIDSPMLYDPKSERPALIPRLVPFVSNVSRRSQSDGKHDGSKPNAEPDVDV